MKLNPQYLRARIELLDRLCLCGLEFLPLAAISDELETYPNATVIHNSRTGKFALSTTNQHANWADVLHLIGIDR